jgi:hypothetical protein
MVHFFKTFFGGNNGCFLLLLKKNYDILFSGDTNELKEQNQI